MYSYTENELGEKPTVKKEHISLLLRIKNLIIKLWQYFTSI